LVEQYENFISSKNAILRVTHHDTKISNVLFDQNEKVICVIDLDTVMPGYFISDVGDMCRTYLPNVSEEEQNIDLIQIDKGRWDAIKEGYLLAMGDLLTSFEKAHFEFAGSFMIYMQALRFLTDHLNNDVYYGAKYNGQNYVRAINQIALLKAYYQIIQ
jgi:aminoglycoside phosphotransferase (APT) family kinase protein